MAPGTLCQGPSVPALAQKTNSQDQVWEETIPKRCEGGTGTWAQLADLQPWDMRRAVQVLQATGVGVSQPEWPFAQPTSNLRDSLKYPESLPVSPK